MSLDVRCPARTDNPLGHQAVALVCELYGDVIESRRQPIIIGTDTFFALQTTRALKRRERDALASRTAIVKLHVEMAVLQHPQGPVYQLHIILFQVGSLDKGEYAQRKRNGDKIAAVIVSVIPHIHFHGLNIRAFERDETVTLLHRDTKHSLNALLLPHLGVDKLEPWPSGNGALQIVYGKILEVSLAQR